MKLAVDSSSFAKRYIEEYGSDKLDDMLQRTTELGLCVILVPEILSALNRRLREGSVSGKDYRQAKRGLLNDVRDATVLQLTPAVVANSIDLQEKNAMRAMDALHVACALEWKADLFVTSGKRQFNAAVNAGILAEYLGRPDQ